METQLIEPLTFFQLLIVLGLVLGAVIGLVIFLSKRGFSFSKRGTTVVFGENGEEIRIDKDQAYNLVVFLDALNTKDDITKIKNLVFDRQKKFCKEKIICFRDDLLNNFKTVLLKEFDSEIEVITHRDFLYFSLLGEKAYYQAMSLILDDFEENGLANKGDIDKYAYDRSSSVISSIESLFNSLYSGITSVDKSAFDEMWSRMNDDFYKELVLIYKTAIRISKKGAEKKNEYKRHLYEKVREIEGISESQFMRMFDSIQSEDFLDI